MCVFQEQLNRYERAIYASLSGNLKPVWLSVFENMIWSVVLSLHCSDNQFVCFRSWRCVSHGRIVCGHTSGWWWTHWWKRNWYLREWLTRWWRRCLEITRRRSMTSPNHPMIVCIINVELNSWYFLCSWTMEKVFEELQASESKVKCKWAEFQ